MDIKNALLADRTKEYYETLAKQIGSDNILLGELVDLVTTKDKKISNRAAWVLSKCADRNIKLITPYLKPLINNLTLSSDDGVKRNTLRVLQDIEVPEEYYGILADQCFKFLGSNKEAIAIKVFAMTVLSNICKEVPELKNELRIIIEDQMPYGSAGFKSRAKKVIKNL